MRKPVIHAVIAIVLHLAALVAMMLALNWNIYAVVVANMIFALIMCMLNGYSIRKAVHYKQEIVRTFIIPSISSVFMGLAVYGVYRLLFLATHINEIATIVAILVGMCVYGILILLLKGVSEAELAGFPKGTLLVRICKKLRLL
jgi:stage V sporulation protein B